MSNVNLTPEIAQLLEANGISLEMLQLATALTQSPNVANLAKDKLIAEKRKEYEERWRQEIGNLVSTTAQDLQDSGNLPDCSFSLTIVVKEGRIDFEDANSVSWKILGLRGSGTHAPTERAGKSIVFDGETYPTFRAVLDHLGINPKGASAHVVLDGYCKKHSCQYDYVEKSPETTGENPVETTK